MNYESKILELAHTKKRLIVNGMYHKDTVFIVDFYNCYCNMISFCKYKTFSLESYLICMKRILTLVKTRKTVIVSKNIFEVDPKVISNLLLFYPNVSYFVVEDACDVKSTNKERDDYFCIAYQSVCKEKSVIITNDKFSNFDALVKEIKPFNTTKLGFRSANKASFTEKMLEETSKGLCFSKINRTSFSYYCS